MTGMPCVLLGLDTDSQDCLLIQNIKTAGEKDLICNRNNEA